MSRLASVESSSLVLASHGWWHKRRSVGDFDCHREEVKKWHRFSARLGSVIELSDSNKDKEEGHDLDSTLANTMNGASSSVESPSKKRRTSEAGGVVLSVGFVTLLPSALALPPTLFIRYSTVPLCFPTWTSKSGLFQAKNSTRKSGLFVSDLKCYLMSFRCKSKEGESGEGRFCSYGQCGSFPEQNSCWHKQLTPTTKATHLCWPPSQGI